MTEKTTIVRPASIGLEKNYFPIDNNNIPTPPVAVQALNMLLDSGFEGKRVWECAVGEGFLAQEMERLGATVVGSDLRKPDDGHAIYGVGGIDIATTAMPTIGGSVPDLIVTNPPYGALLRPFIAAVKRWCGDPNCPPIWFLLAQHSMASGWVHTEVGHLIRAYNPITFGLPYLKDGKWVSGGAFKHAWVKFHPEPDPYGIDCQFITREWMKERA